MQETLTFPTLGSPPRFTFPELIPYNHDDHHQHHESCSELSSSTSTPFVSAPSSPSRMKGFYFSAPTSPSWAQQQQILAAQSNPPYWPVRQQAQLQVQQDAVDDSSFQSISSWSHKTQDISQADSGSFSSNGSLKSPQAEHLANPSQSLHPAASPYTWSQSSVRKEHQGSSTPTQHSPHSDLGHTRSTSYPECVLTKHEEGPNWAQQSLQAEHHSTEAWYLETSRTEHVGGSHRYQVLPQMSDSHIVSNHAAAHIALTKLQVEDPVVSYSRKSFYASAVPFAWEERPGTPKARSVTSEASFGEDDTASVLLSGSSDFEFSARFAELEEPPMSPTPISPSPNHFKHHVAAYGSPSPTYKQARANGSVQSGATSEEHIWPLRPPPRLDNAVLPMKQLMKDNANEHKRGYGSLSSLSAPQSPRSPRKFDIRGVLCGISSPTDAVFDPFLVAMEKSIGQGRDEFTNSEAQKAAKKGVSRGAAHHRRTQSSSPLRVFHWDEHSAKSNSSSNGSLSMDDIKSKHPIQREIDARHNVATPKGSRRWTFRGFLHRKSESGGESARHSNTSSSLRSSGRESNLSSTSRRESCCSSAMGELPMDISNCGDDMNAIKMRGASSPLSNSSSTMPSTPPSILSPSSSNNSSKGKPNGHHKGPYALHYDMQRAHTEELRKKTFLPYKQGLLGCLGFPSKSYRAIATVSKVVQSVS